MSSKWDSTGITFRPETWSALAEHLLPGAFVLAFASSRGWHRLACAMEDAGLVMQPSIFVNGLAMDVPFCLGWVQSQGFPKASRLDKKLDEMAGKLDEREVVGEYRYPDGKPRNTKMHETKRKGIYSDIKTDDSLNDRSIIAPATPLARAWQGHRYGGQILRDALTPIICAQKPWTGKRLDCIVETGAGALNIEEARIATASDDSNSRGNRGLGRSKGGLYGNSSCYSQDDEFTIEEYHQHRGRWPQNFCLVHTPFCQKAGVRRVRGSHPVKPGGGQCETTYTKPRHVPIAPTPRAPFDYTDADGLETVTAWRCPIACPECGLTWLATDKEVCPECKATGEWQCAARRLGEQSGERPVSGTAKLGKLNTSRPESAIVYGEYHPHESKMPNDEGTCARYFLQADWSYEVAEYLAEIDAGEWQCTITCTECGNVWLAKNKEICPKCKVMGEWICPVRRLGEQSGERKAGVAIRHRSGGNNPQFMSGDKPKPPMPDMTYGDRGTCARYFHQSDWSYEIAERLATVDPVHYCPKSSSRERESGLFGIMPCVKCGKLSSKTHIDDKGKEVQCRRCGHETVKPISLNRYLSELLLPPPEYAPRRILVPFAGVASEMLGALLANFEEIVGVEMDAEYCAIGEARMQYWASRPEQMSLF